MKGKHNKQDTRIGIIFILVVFLIGCSGSKKENPGAKQSLDEAEIKKPDAQIILEKAKQPDFEKETLVALELHSQESEAIYDADAPVIIRVELYSPRSFAVLNYNRYKTKNGKPIELPEVKADNSDKTWWQELQLTFFSGESKGELKFYANASPGEEQPNLGQGEVGSLEIIIGEKAFPQPGKYNLKAVWQNPKYGRIESDALPITLVKEHLAEAERDLLRVKVLLAKKENSTAMLLIKKLAEDKPGSYTIRYYLAEAHEKNNNLKEALAQYQHALTLFPREKPGEPWEPPVGLYIKIRELMEKLGKDKKQDSR